MEFTKEVKTLSDAYKKLGLELLKGIMLSEKKTVSKITYCVIPLNSAFCKRHSMLYRIGLKGYQGLDKVGRRVSLPYVHPIKGWHEGALHDDGNCSVSSLWWRLHKSIQVIKMA